MGYNPQESLENTTSTMCTLLGVHTQLSLDTRMTAYMFIPFFFGEQESKTQTFKNATRVDGWTNPSEKYARSSNWIMKAVSFRGENSKKMFELTQT